jgi:LysR family transcriptional regulator, carnitine catabolism transcriptional activator
MESGSSVRSLLDRAFEGLEPAAGPAYEAAYLSTAIGMVKAGLGVTILPSSAIAFESARGLRSRPIDHPALTRTIGVLERTDRTLSPAAQTFLETLGRLCHGRNGQAPLAKRAT